MKLMTTDAQADKNGDVVGGTGGSYNRTRALAQSRASVDQALKGEITPGGEQDDPDESEKPGRNIEGGLGDEVYREVAAKYERELGREPHIGDPHQAGWDLYSVDPETGAERLIEVKGKGCPWTEDEVVELTRAQVHKAFDKQMSDPWYLYVVERTEDDNFYVLPIENPIQRAGKWILCGQPWRKIAKEPRRVVFKPTGIV